MVLVVLTDLYVVFRLFFLPPSLTPNRSSVRFVDYISLPFAYIKLAADFVQAPMVGSAAERLTKELRESPPFLTASIYK